MFISKKRLKKMEQRIKSLESKSSTHIWGMGEVTFPEFAKNIDTILNRMKKPPAATDGMEDLK